MAYVADEREAVVDLSGEVGHRWSYSSIRAAVAVEGDVHVAVVGHYFLVAIRHPWILEIGGSNADGILEPAGAGLVGIGLVGEDLPCGVGKAGCVAAEPGHMHAGIHSGAYNAVLVVGGCAASPVDRNGDLVAKKQAPLRGIGPCVEGVFDVAVDGCGCGPYGLGSGNVDLVALLALPLDKVGGDVNRLLGADHQVGTVDNGIGELQPEDIFVKGNEASGHALGDPVKLVLALIGGADEPDGYAGGYVGLTCHGIHRNGVVAHPGHPDVPENGYPLNGHRRCGIRGGGGHHCLVHLHRKGPCGPLGEGLGGKDIIIAQNGNLGADYLQFDPACVGDLNHPSDAGNVRGSHLGAVAAAGNAEDNTASQTVNGGLHGFKGDEVELNHRPVVGADVLSGFHRFRRPVNSGG